MSLGGNVNQYYAVNFVKNLKYDLKCNIICGQILPLKYVTVSEIAHALWRNHFCKKKLIGVIDKNEIFEKFSYFEMIAISDEFDKYEEEIKKKIPNLNIPKMWKKILEEFIYLIKMEVIRLFQKKIIKFSSVGDILIFWDNLCWTQQVTINRVKTAVKIIDNSNLSIMGKYVLACENCLEEKIRYLYKLLPEDFITEFETKIEEDSESLPNYLVLFWTYYIEKKQEKCSNFIGRKELYSFLFEYSINNEKETAVQYIWEKFANEEMEEYLRLDQFIYDSNSNIKYYLFQQLSDIQQEEMIEKVLNILFRYVRNLLRWHNAFDIEKYVLEVMKSKNVLNAFKIVMSCAKKYLLDLIEYATLWDEFIFTRKSELENNFQDICKEFFSSYYTNLNINYYKITYSSLLRAGASRDIKEHMYTKTAGEACNQLITYLGSDSLEGILELAFETEEVSEFRKHLFSTMGREICTNLIKNGEYEQVNKFLNKYCDEKMITDFKENLAYTEREQFVYLLPCRFSEFNDLVFHMNNFICWAFEDDKEKIFTYKSKVFDLEAGFQNNVHFFLRLKFLIKAKQWALVEKYFEWIYTATADKVCSAEDIFSHIKKIMFRIFIGPLKLSFHYIGYYDLIKRFIICCFKQNEMKELKEQYSKMDLYFNIYEVMRYRKYEEIDDLLDWCFSSDKDKIDEFKLGFMISFGKLYLFNRIQWHLFNIREVTDLFKWFKPSTASANLFKKKFMTLMRSIKEGKVKEVGSKDEKEWAVIHKNLTESFEVLSNSVINVLSGEQNQIVAHQEVIRKSDLIKEKILELNFDYLNEIECFDIEKSS